MQYGYIHLFVNHSIQFVSVLSNIIHINTVERLWKGLKNYVRMLRPQTFIGHTIAKHYLNQTIEKEGLMTKILEILSKYRLFV